MKRALIIVNPTLGADSLRALHAELGLHFYPAGITYEVHATLPDNQVGDAARARAREGFHFVVAAGGDGTVAAAINVLAGGNVPLGIIPLGTGNLVARELGVPREVGDAVALLAGKPAHRRIDALRIGERVFVLNAGIGISAAIMAGTSREEKQLLGPAAYVGTGIRRVPLFPPMRVTLTVDGRTRTLLAMDVAVLNCGLLARTIYPRVADVRVDDGKLDVLVLRTMGVLDYPRYFLDLLLRRPATPKALYFRATQRVVISCRTPQAVQADGDIIGSTPVEIDVLPSAVTMLVPDLSPIGN